MYKAFVNNTKSHKNKGNDWWLCILKLGISIHPDIPTKESKASQGMKGDINTYIYMEMTPTYITKIPKNKFLKYDPVEKSAKCLNKNLNKYIFFRVLCLFNILET